MDTYHIQNDQVGPVDVVPAGFEVVPLFDFDLNDLLEGVGHSQDHEQNLEDHHQVVIRGDVPSKAANK